MKNAIMRNGLALAVLACATLVAAQERAFAQQGCIEKVPPPPIDVQAVPKTKSVDVAWNAPEPTNACIDSYSYIVYKKNQNRGARSLPSQIREYSLTIKNLEPDTEYTVELTSVNQLKGASKPATVTFRTLKACNLQVKPGAVNPVFLNQNSAKTLLLSWLPPKNGACTDSYQVDGYEVKSNKRVLNSNSIDPKAKVTSLAPGKEYKFLITPQNKRGGGPTTRVTYKMKNKFEVVASGSVPAKGRRMFAA